MASIAGRAAERIFVSIPAWRSVVESLAGTRAPITWLPVPSTIPRVDDPAGSRLIKARIAGNHPLVGHLGTYGRLIRPTLEASLPGLLSATDCRVVLLGRHGDAVRGDLVARHPEIADRVAAPGVLSDADLSRHIAACDVMLQPYPDGITTRRTSVMAALLHGRPVVTTTGWLTESFWSGCGSVVLSSANEPGALVSATSQLLAEPLRLADLSVRARQLYEERFDLSHTIDILRDDSSWRPVTTSLRPRFQGRDNGVAR
jgi:glycosyltransferase involved in cell wall biosynthesis